MFALGLAAMKFGKNLSDLSIPEWKGYNLDYNDLKAEIKLVANDQASLYSLHHKFTDNFNVINLFLKTKYGEISRKFDYYENNFAQLLREHANNSPPGDNENTVGTNVQLIKLDILRSSLIDLSISLKKLSKFILIQKIAVKKIFKKFLKKSPSNKSEKFILNLKLHLNKDPDSFINFNLVSLTIKLTNLINLIKFEINKLSNGDVENDLDSENFSDFSASVSSLPLSLNMKFDFNIFLKNNFHLPFLLPDDLNNFNQVLLNLNIYLSFKNWNKEASTSSLIYLQNDKLTVNKSDNNFNGDRASSLGNDLLEPSFILSEHHNPLSLIVCYIGGLRKYSYCFLPNSIVNLILQYLQDPNNKQLKSELKNYYQTNRFNSLTKLTIETLLNNVLTPKVKIYFKSLRYQSDNDDKSPNNDEPFSNIYHDNKYFLHLNYDIYTTDSANHINTTKFLIPKNYRQSETNVDSTKKDDIDSDEDTDSNLSCDEDVDSSIFLELDKFPFNTLTVYSNDVNLLNFEKSVLSEIDENLLANKYSSTLLNKLPTGVQQLVTDNNSINLFKSFNIYQYSLSCYYNIIPKNLNNHFSNLLNLNLFKNYENIDNFNKDLNLDSNIIKQNSDKIIQNKHSLNDLKSQQRRQQRRDQYQRYDDRQRQQLRQKQYFEAGFRPTLTKKDSVQSISSLALSLFTGDRYKNKENLDELIAVEDNESLKSFWKDTTYNNQHNYPEISFDLNNISPTNMAYGSARKSKDTSLFLGDYDFVTNIMRLKNKVYQKPTSKSSLKSSLGNHNDYQSINGYEQNINGYGYGYGTNSLDLESPASLSEEELSYYHQIYNYNYEYDKIITMFQTTLGFTSLFISGIELGILFSLFKLGQNSNNFKLALNLWLFFILIIGLFISLICSCLSAFLLTRKRFPVKFWQGVVVVLDFVFISICVVLCSLTFSS